MSARGFISFEKFALSHCGRKVSAGYYYTFKTQLWKLNYFPCFAPTCPYTMNIEAKERGRCAHGRRLLNFHMALEFRNTSKRLRAGCGCVSASPIPDVRNQLQGTWRTRSYCSRQNKSLTASDVIYPSSSSCFPIFCSSTFNYEFVVWTDDDDEHTFFRTGPSKLTGQRQPSQ